MKEDNQPFIKEDNRIKEKLYYLKEKIDLSYYYSLVVLIKILNKNKNQALF